MQKEFSLKTQYMNINILHRKFLVNYVRNRVNFTSAAYIYIYIYIYNNMSQENLNNLY